MYAVQRQFETYMNPANIAVEYTVPSEHSWVINGGWGNPCGNITRAISGVIHAFMICSLFSFIGSIPYVI